MMQETEAIFYSNLMRESCTVVIGRTVLFFGGYSKSRQISQITRLGLMRIGTLPFALQQGICLIMGNQIFLGFPGTEQLPKKSLWTRLSDKSFKYCYQKFFQARTWRFSTKLKRGSNTMGANSSNMTKKQLWLQENRRRWWSRSIYRNCRGNNMQWVRWMALIDFSASRPYLSEKIYLYSVSFICFFRDVSCSRIYVKIQVNSSIELRPVGQNGLVDRESMTKLRLVWQKIVGHQLSLKKWNFRATTNPFKMDFNVHHFRRNSNDSGRRFRALA